MRDHVQLMIGRWRQEPGAVIATRAQHVEHARQIAEIHVPGLYPEAKVAGGRRAVKRCPETGRWLVTLTR